MGSRSYSFFEYCCSCPFRVNLTLFYDQIIVLNLPMYLKLFTITTRTHKQFFALALACFWSSYFPLRLLLRVMEVFRSKTGSDASPIGLLSKGYLHLLLLVIISGSKGSFMEVVALIDYFFDLMFDLFFADGAIGVRWVLSFGFLLAVKCFE